MKTKRWSMLFLMIAAGMSSCQKDDVKTPQNPASVSQISERLSVQNVRMNKYTLARKFDAMEQQQGKQEERTVGKPVLTTATSDEILGLHLNSVTVYDGASVKRLISTNISITQNEDNVGYAISLKEPVLEVKLGGVLEIPRSACRGREDGVGSVVFCGPKRSGSGGGVSVVICENTNQVKCAELLPEDFFN